MIHEDMKKFFEGFPTNAHPMAILSAMVASLSTYYPGTEEESNDTNFVRLIAKIRTLAAYAYKKSIGQPTIYPRNDLSYGANFLHMMFAVPAEEYVVNPVMNKTAARRPCAWSAAVEPTSSPQFRPESVPCGVHFMAEPTKRFSKCCR
jgi:citrate synthase